MLRLKSRTLWGVAIFWLVLLVAGLWFRQEIQEWFRPALPGSTANHPASEQDTAHQTTEHEHMSLPVVEDGAAFYICSMHPSVRAESPGTCPICSMDLIPVSAEQVGSGTVQIDARRRQLIGVTTSEVVTQDLTRTIHPWTRGETSTRAVSS